MAGFSATSSKSLLAAKKRLQKFLKELDTIPEAEIDKEIPKIKAEAIARTPFKTGKLERSVYVRKSKNIRDRVGILAGASARSPKGYDYAGIQHERRDFYHPIKGTDHYLSDPFNKGVRRLKRRIRYRMKKAAPKG